jgi:hypothetical protein
MIPGSRGFPPAVPALASCLTLAALFTSIFPDHSGGRFVPDGVRCLIAGLGGAVPVAAAAWWTLRRGFAASRRSAGVAIGGFAGLAGLTMLELHCPNFRLPHLLLWHLAVVAAGAASGYFFGSNRKAAELMRLGPPESQSPKA